MSETLKNHVDILGIPVRCLDLAGLQQTFFSAIDSWEKDPVTIAYVNTHVLNLAHVDPELHRQMNAMSVIYADGIGPVFAARIMGACRLVKMTGADWIEPLAAAMAERKLRIFILAGMPGVAEKAADRLTRRCPGLEIAGTGDGFFSGKSEAQTLQAIRDARPDALFVGMGTPRQEAWITANQRELPVKVIWAVGALFDYLAEKEKRAPAWARRSGLEWLWRLWMDPSGKWKRYLWGNPLFLWRVFRQRLRNR